MRHCDWTCDYAYRGTNDRASQRGYIHRPYSVDIVESEKDAAQEDTDMQQHLSLYLNMIILLYLIGLESHVTGRCHRNEKADMSILCRQI